jgi:hypothetical protein
VQRYGSAYLVTSLSLSLVSFSLCYALIASGVDVAALLAKLGFTVSDSSEQVGVLTLAYGTCQRDQAPAGDPRVEKPSFARGRRWPLIPPLRLSGAQGGFAHPISAHSGTHTSRGSVDGPQRRRSVVLESLSLFVYVSMPFAPATSLMGSTSLRDMS